jgi:hypothetical protein
MGISPSIKQRGGFIPPPFVWNPALCMFDKILCQIPGTALPSYLGSFIVKMWIAMFAPLKPVQFLFQETNVLIQYPRFRWCMCSFPGFKCSGCIEMKFRNYIFSKQRVRPSIHSDLLLLTSPQGAIIDANLAPNPHEVPGVQSNNAPCEWTLNKKISGH